MESDKTNFEHRLKSAKLEGKRISQVSCIIVAVLGVSLASYLHLNNEAETKKLNNELSLVQNQVREQEIEIAEMNAKTYRESAIQAQIEKQTLKPISETHYKILTSVYQDSKTDELTKKIIKDMMADNIVTVEEFSRYSALFNTAIEKINQEKTKEDLIRNLSK